MREAKPLVKTAILAYLKHEIKTNIIHIKGEHLEIIRGKTIQMRAVLFSEGVFFNFKRFRFWSCMVIAFIFIVGSSSNLILPSSSLFL